MNRLQKSLFPCVLLNSVLQIASHSKSMGDPAEQVDLIRLAYLFEDFLGLVALLRWEYEIGFFNPVVSTARSAASLVLHSRVCCTSPSLSHPLVSPISSNVSSRDPPLALYENQKGESWTYPQQQYSKPP